MIHQVSAVPSTLYQKIKLILDGSLLVISGDPLIRQPTNTASLLLEIQPNEEPPYLTGFHFEETFYIQVAPEYTMLVPPIMDDFLNPQVAVMMLQMQYFPGLGLGRNHQGIAKFSNIPTQHYSFGLGYKPTKENYAQKAKEAHEKALAKKEGRLTPMKKVKILPTTNSYWIREGDDFPFCGFSEPLINPASGKHTLSLEIFFDMEPYFDNLSGK